jgi:hypothetical protein
LLSETTFRIKIKVCSFFGLEEFFDSGHESDQVIGRPGGGQKGLPSEPERILVTEGLSLKAAEKMKRGF